MQNGLPIGVFDSGIGGLTVASSIASILPNEQILYFGDTARCPYGDRDPQEVIEFSCQIVDFLVEHGVKLVVVACNSATAVALPTLTGRYSVPVIGVINPGARAAVKATSSRRIGVIGTVVTVQTGAYERSIKRLDPTSHVISLACPRFVPLVEQGSTKGSELDKIVEESLAPLFPYDVEALILGCTHYPLLQPAIQRVMGPHVKLISSAEETAREVYQLLQETDSLRPTQVGTPRHRYYTTGTKDTMAMALTRWHLDLPGDVRHIEEIDKMATPNVR